MSHNWIKKEQFDQITNRLAIYEQIRLRQDLINSMVGQLYPSILKDEITILHDKLYQPEITGSWYQNRNLNKILDDV